MARNHRRHERTKALIAQCSRFLAFVVLLAASPATGVAQEVALTFDDLPAHGPLPPGMTRLEVAKSIIATLKAANAPQVYGSPTR